MRRLDDDGEQAEHEVPRHLARRAAQETRVVYAQADTAWRPYGCPASADCCHRAMTSRPPWLWPSEWTVLEEALAAERRALPPARADGACPFLDDAGRRCTVYAHRPFGCRTFFCERVTGPGQQPTEATNGLLERLEALNRRVSAEAAPRPLPEWVTRARASR